MRDRLAVLRETPKLKKLSGFLITTPSNLFYLAGFRAEGSFGVLTQSESKIFIPELLGQRAKEAVRNFEVVAFRGKPLERVGKFLAKEGVRKLGFEAGEVSVKTYREMEKAFRNVKLVPLYGLVEDMRMVKTAEEVGLIKKSAEICVAAFRFVTRRIRIGMKERTVAGQLEYFMKKRGAEKPPFEIIVASGENTAYPHHQTGEREIRPGDCLVIDIGCVYKGYCSDLTRSIFLDIIKANRRQRLRAPLPVEFRGKYKNIYQTVLRAQREAIEKIGPGIRCSDIDSAARKVIKAAGLGQYFIHRTGHGVGVDVHELPRLEENSTQVLRPGMVLTVEPGVYIPGFGGVRIEDMVLVIEKGREILTEDIFERKKGLIYDCGK